ncbi:MAG: hypothetical protein ABI585_15395 [Betaproteobacteria bacterium]
MTPTATRHRIVSRGDLPGSDGGVYNPGAIVEGDAIVLIARREIDYRFTSIVHAERIVVDPRTLDVVAHRTLRRIGYSDDARIEDFRSIRHRGETLVVHTMVHADRIRPVLARADETSITFVGELEMPFATTRIEKNWVLFEHHGELHCLYRLEPLTILAREGGGRWRVCKRDHLAWPTGFPASLSNSSNLVPFEGGHLGFWHARVDERYVQGAMLLDEKLDIVAATGVLLDGRDAAPGQKAGVLYVSSLVVHDGRVLAFYGEGDAHTGVAILDAAALADALRRHAFVPRRPVTIRLAPTSMGELFRAMVALEALRNEQGDRALWTHVPDANLHDVVRRFGVRELTVRDLAERSRFDYDVGSLLAAAAPAASRRS